MKNFLAALFAIVCATSSMCQAEERTTTEYCGAISLASFKCTGFNPPQDKFISRVCYDAQSDMMLLRLVAEHNPLVEREYCYCGLGSARVDKFLKCADGMGFLYATMIRGHFFCVGVDVRVPSGTNPHKGPFRGESFFDSPNVGCLPMSKEERRRKFQEFLRDPGR